MISCMNMLFEIYAVLVLLSRVVVSMQFTVVKINEWEVDVSMQFIFDNFLLASIL